LIFGREVFEGVENCPSKYLGHESKRVEGGMYIFAKLYVEIDLNEGLPKLIILDLEESQWSEALYYENMAFKCHLYHDFVISWRLV
jgi:hypothetical protein